MQLGEVSRSLPAFCGLEMKVQSVSSTGSQFLGRAWLGGATGALVFASMKQVSAGACIMEWHVPERQASRSSLRDAQSQRQRVP